MTDFKILLACAALAAAFLAGCSSSSGAKKVHGKDSIVDDDIPSLNYLYSVDTPESELFSTATRLYASGLFLEAKAAFEALRDGYPFGPYAEFSQLKIADCFFETREFGSAAVLYDEFVKEYPAHPAVPYALVQGGRSYQISVTAVGRDPEPLRKAIVMYDRAVEQFPDSPYAAVANSYRIEAQSSLIAHEEAIVNFYKKIGKEEASKARLAALQQMKENQLNTVAPDPDIRPVLVSEVPDGSTVDEAIAAAGSGAEASLPGSQQPADESQLKIECNREDEFIMVFLDQAAGPQSMPSGKLTPSNGELRVELPLTLRDAIERDCFENGDLAVSPQGVLILKSSRPGRAASLRNPTRVMISLQ